MESLLHQTFSRIKPLFGERGGSARKHFPHREIKEFLDRSDEVISFATSKCGSEESEKCVQVFNLLKQSEEKVTVTSGYVIFGIYLDLLEYFLSKLVNQMQIMPALKEENRLLTEKLQSLLTNVENITEEFDSLLDVDIISGQSEESLQNVLCSYEAYIDKTRNPFYVIVLDPLSKFPRRLRNFNGMPIIYSIIRDTDEHYDLEVKYTQAMIADLEEAQLCLKKIYKSLFHSHSNLLSVQATFNGPVCMIKFIVPLKGCIPCVDDCELPKQIGRFRTKVCTGWVKFTGYKERIGSLPLHYGSAISPDNFTRFYPEEENDISFGTLGGFVTINQKQYGVSAGHVFKESEEIHNTSPMSQQIRYKMVSTGQVVNSGGAMAQMISRLRSEFAEGDFRKLMMSFGLRHAVNSYLKSWSLEAININEYTRIGTLVGAYSRKFSCADQHNNVTEIAADVGVVELDKEYMNPPSHIFTLIGESRSFVFPNHMLDEDTIENYLRLEIEKRENILLIGQGANSERPTQLLMNMDNQKYVRNWFPKKSLGTADNKDDPVYECLVGEIQNDCWGEGDSGTWFWIADPDCAVQYNINGNPFIGMGIGTEGNLCILLPMKTVLMATKNIIDLATVISDSVR